MLSLKGLSLGLIENVSLQQFLKLANIPLWAQLFSGTILIRLKSFMHRVHSIST
jgi:hypothetical protein